MPVSEQHIPKEAADALFAVLVTRGSPRAAIAAALNAWPGTKTAYAALVTQDEPVRDAKWWNNTLILPLGEQE